MNHGCAPSSFWIFPLHFSLFTKAHVICNMPITIWFICIGGPNLHWRYNKEVPSSLLFPKYHVECDWSSDNKTSYNHYFLVTMVDNSSKVHNQSRPVARRLSTCMADKHTVHRMALLVDCSGYLPKEFVSQKHKFSDFVDSTILWPSTWWWGTSVENPTQTSYSPLCILNVWRAIVYLSISIFLLNILIQHQHD